MGYAFNEPATPAARACARARRRALFLTPQRPPLPRLTTEQPAPAGQTDRWALDAHKVATFVALQLLQEPPSGLDRWLTSKFVAAWRDKRPEALFQTVGGAEVSLDILGGLVVEEGRGTVTGTIRLFPIPRLSIDPESRFVQLFGIKSRWSESELRPFLEDLEGAPKLLLKFTRSLMEEGVRYHCAR